MEEQGSKCACSKCKWKLPRDGFFEAPGERVGKGQKKDTRVRHTRLPRKSWPWQPRGRQNDVWNSYFECSVKTVIYFWMNGLLTVSQLT